MDYLLEQVLNGLALGAIYAFIALGYTMVYGIIKLINFAHGEFFMVGAFLGWGVLTFLGLDMVGLPWPLPMVVALGGAMLAAALGAGGLAVVTERLAYKPLRGASRIAALLTALGVSLFLQNMGIQVFTAEQKAFPDTRQFIPMAQVADHAGETFDGSVYALFEVELATGATSEVREVVARAGEPLDVAALDALDGRQWHGKPVAGVFVDRPLGVLSRKLLILVGLAISFAGLWLVVHRTQLGRAMRAVSANAEAARLMGIRVDRVISATFFLGATLAGIGGVIWGIRYGKLEPFMGFLPGLKAFIAAVLGGIGSLEGAVLGGLCLGLLEVLVPAYLPSGLTGYKDAIAFIVLIAILLVKPSGLLGRAEGEKV